VILKVKKCRCCGETAFERQRNVRVSPFFAKYGLQIQVFSGLPKEIELIERADSFRFPTKFVVRTVLKVLDKFSSFFRQTIFIPYGFCKNCDFIAPWFEISNDQLLDYYSYYLTDSYKKHRLEIEKGYKNICESHGSREEFDLRQADYNRFIFPKLQDLAKFQKVKTLRMLDFGGGDSGVQPDTSIVDCTVYDVGEKEIKFEENGYPQFDFIQALHVLEHVGNPLETFRIAYDKCSTGGVIYIEVPMEHSGFDESNSFSLPYACDEHINKFTVNSLSKMASSTGGNIEMVVEDSIKTMHRGDTKIIRLIVRKV